MHVHEDFSKTRGHNTCKIIVTGTIFSNKKIFSLPLTYAYYATLRQSVAEKFDILGYYFAFYVQLIL